MTNSSSQRLSIALNLCERTISLLNAAAQSEVVNLLGAIVIAFKEKNFIAAVDLCRKLPRHDIVGFWQSVDWMEDNSTSEKADALLFAHYLQTTKALGDWRVSFLYGFDRPLVENSNEYIFELASKLIEEKKSLHKLI